MSLVHPLRRNKKRKWTNKMSKKSIYSPCGPVSHLKCISLPKSKELLQTSIRPPYDQLGAFSIFDLGKINKMTTTIFRLKKGEEKKLLNEQGGKICPDWEQKRLITS